MSKTGTRAAVLTLPGDTEIHVTREFDAPAHLVFRAYTTPELVRRWWHAKRGAISVVEIDLRVGGAWRYAMVTSEGGFEVAFHGVFREIVENERIVSTEIFEGAPDAEAINTVTFDETDGRTTLRIVMRLPSKEVRDAILATGMEDGLQDALDLLEEAAAGEG